MSTIGLILNETSRPRREVRRILEYALEQIGGLDRGRLAVKVREREPDQAGGGCAYIAGNNPKWAGRNHYAISVTIPTDPKDDGLHHWYGWPTVCWHSRRARLLAEEKGAPAVYAMWSLAYERGERRFGRWPIYVLNDWREALLHLATHELAHILAQDRQRSRGSHSEIECELLAERVLNQWRLDTEPEGGSMADPETITLAKMGDGAVWHILAGHVTDDVMKTACGIRRAPTETDPGVDARAVRHRGANVCANCRVQHVNHNQGGTVSSITDELNKEAGKAATAAKTDGKSDGKGGTATATRTHRRGGKTKLSAIAAAEQILREEAKPLHVKELTAKILAMPNTKLGGKTPDATVGAILAVASKKPGSVFRRTKPGTYAIRKGK
jgi:hypothetical protein